MGGSGSYSCWPGGGFLVTKKSCASEVMINTDEHCRVVLITTVLLRNKH